MRDVELYPENKMIDHRKYVIEHCHTIVVKVGTRLLTDTGRIPILIAQIAALREKGFQVLLVSSGAVGLGMKLLNRTRRPGKLAEVQALASLGQSKLISAYNHECRKYGFFAAQLLLTAEDLRARERHLNVLNCIRSLWNNNILPIANENDAVSVKELKFGDNDFLAAALATLTRTELTVILTTECGLREKHHGVLGERISTVGNISEELKQSAEGTDDKNFSIGGMISKVRAAEMVTHSGDYLWVADGRVDDILLRIANAEDVGTLFLPRNEHQLQSRKRWIRYFSKNKGRLIIDGGAVIALCEHGKSLLPSGVKAVEGAFSRGDTVEIAGPDGEVVARGLCNYSAADCGRLAGHQSTEIEKLLQTGAEDEEIVHRDNLALIS